MNRRIPSGDAEHLEYYFPLLQSFSDIRNALCARTASCWHPLSLSLGEGSASDLSRLLPFERKYGRALDLYAFQLYRGESLAAFYYDYAKFASAVPVAKAVLISEFGIDAIDFR